MAANLPQANIRTVWLYHSTEHPFLSSLRAQIFERAFAEPTFAPPRARCYNERNPNILLGQDRKSTRLNSSHVKISYAVFCLKKKKRTRKVVVQHYNN